MAQVKPRAWCYKVDFWLQVQEIGPVLHRCAAFVAGAVNRAALWYAVFASDLAANRLGRLGDMNLDVQVLWQAQNFVDIEVQDSWQAQGDKSY